MAFIPPLHPVPTSFVSVLLGEVAMQRLQPVLRRQGQPQDAHAHPHGIKAVPLPHLPRPEVPDERDAEDAPEQLPRDSAQKGASARNSRCQRSRRED